MPSATFNIPRPINAESASVAVINHRFVTRAAAGVVDGTGAGLSADAVVHDEGAAIGATFAAGEAAPIVPVNTGGTVPIEAGAAVADFDEVMSDAASRAITFVAGGGALALGRVVNGSSAGAAGDLLSVELYPKTAQHI